MGYHLAGFDVVGVDLDPKVGRHFPFEFHHGDAVEFIRDHAHEFDAVHASPPCQPFSRMTNCRPGLAQDYPDLIDATRQALEATGLPYVIENVEGSTVRPDLVLCGWSFGRLLYRHRLFESNLPLVPMPHRPHEMPASRAGHWTPGTIMSVSGHVAPVSHAREIMEIDWMNREELVEAIPPYYAEYVGLQLARQLREAA